MREIYMRGKIETRYEIYFVFCLYNLLKSTTLAQIGHMYIDLTNTGSHVYGSEYTKLNITWLIRDRHQCNLQTSYTLLY